LSKIHEDKERFLKLVDQIASQTGFYTPLMEKDYYLTLILSRVHELSENLIFRGGTCLNKIYYAYYRLSEDLDFSMRLPDPVTRGNRSKAMSPIKDKIERFAAQFGMRIDNKEKAGRNENRQYVYYFSYDSAVQPTRQTIKFEIGLRFNPIAPPEKKSVQHKFIHPFTKEPLFEGGQIVCLSLNETVSEKMRAAALREVIAPRDFYDLDFILKNGFNLAHKQVVEIFKQKLTEDKGDTDLKKYHLNMGRTDAEIKDMRSRIETELFEVLTLEERKNFELDAALSRINKAMKEL